MKSTKNFFSRSKELIDNLDIQVTIDVAYVNIDYGSLRFRLNGNTDIRSIKQMLHMHNYNDNDVCIICAYVLNELCFNTHLDPIVRINDDMIIVGGSLFQSNKAGDFKIIEKETELARDNDLFYCNCTLSGVGNGDLENETADISEDYDMEYRMYLENLSKYIKIAVTDKYEFLLRIVEIMLETNDEVY